MTIENNAAAAPQSPVPQNAKDAEDCIIFGGKRMGRTHLANLERDAERYRWLRHGDNDELVIQRGPVAKDYYWLPRNERLDAMIDAHIAAQDAGKDKP